MQGKVTTARDVTVAVMAVATLPPGAEVRSLQTTDAGAIATVLAEEAVRDALSEAGFVFGPYVHSVMATVATKGPERPVTPGPHNDRQKEAKAEAEAYRAAMEAAEAFVSTLAHAIWRRFLADDQSVPHQWVGEFLRRRVDEGWRFIPPEQQGPPSIPPPQHRGLNRA